MYLHEEHYYLISNHAVARNPLFCEIGIQIHFRKKMNYYLEPLCDILAYKFKDQEFQLLVKLRSRSDFEAFQETKNEGIKGLMQVPASTYIFSQAMSNLQNSLVKKFNYEHSRKGTLMAGRFKRELITTKERVIELIQELNGGVHNKLYSGIWAECAMKRIKGMTSANSYKVLEMKFNGSANLFWQDVKDNLVGQFNNPQIYDQEFKFHFLNRRIFKSISKFLE